MATYIEAAQTLLGLRQSEVNHCSGNESHKSGVANDIMETVTVGKPTADNPTRNGPQSVLDSPKKPSAPAKKPSSKELAAKAKRTLGKTTRRKMNAFKNFYTKADELQAFKRHHGHCNVPQTYTENQPLANWVARMRREKKKLDDNETSILDQRKVAYLESIGFQWGSRRGDALWDARYEQLKMFYEINKHTQVPTKAKILGRWVSTQRDEYRKMKMGLPSNMSKERVEMLERLHFTWDCHMHMEYDMKLTLLAENH